MEHRGGCDHDYGTLPWLGRPGTGPGAGTGDAGDVEGVGSGVHVVAPGVGGGEAEDFAGAVDGEEGAVLADVAGQLDAGEDLGQDFGRGTGEDRVGGRDDEGGAAGDGGGVGLEGLAAGLGRVALVD